MAEVDWHHHIRVVASEDEPHVLDGLRATDMSRPYWLRSVEGLRQCRFNFFRGVTYVIAFMFGCIRWFCEIVLVCFGCRSTYRVMNDDEFTKLFATQWPFAGFVRQEYVSNLPKIGGNVTSHQISSVETFHVSDVETNELVQVTSTADIMVMKPHAFEGTYIEPVRAVFRRRVTGDVHSAWFLYSLEIQNQTMFQELDGHTDAWALAKLFALSAVHYFIILKDHPYIHFQQDLFIEATTQLFPDPTHELRQLLDPHSDFTFEINHNALEAKRSGLNARDTAFCCFDAHTVPRDGIKCLIQRGYDECAPTVGERFGRVPTTELRPHYQAILTLCTAVATRLLQRLHALPYADDRWQEFYRLFRWMHFLRQHLFYPDTIQLSHDDPAALAAVLADHIFLVSVRHSVDHHLFAISDQRTHPMSISIPWSRDVQFNASPGCCAWHCGVGIRSTARVVSLKAWLKHSMYVDLFVTWWNNRLYADGRLHTTKYKFEDPCLQQAAKQFRETLTSIPDTFVPRNRIARSIQW